MKRAMVNEQSMETVQKNKWHSTRIIIVVTFAAALGNFNAAAQLESPVHYVSTNGSNTYPYDTWATAARSVQTAITATEPGDTVRIGQGVFREIFTARADLTISGMGSDKTIINGGWIGETATVVTVPGFCRVWNLKIMCDTHYGGMGISALDGVDMRNCEIAGFPAGTLGNFGRGFEIQGTNTFIDNCRFKTNCGNTIWGGIIQNSTFDNCDWALSVDGNAQMNGCTFSGCGTGVKPGDSTHTSVAVNCLFYGNGTAIVGGQVGGQNCTIVGNTIGYAGSAGATLKNSIVCNNSQYGITGPVTLSHNDVWNNGLNYFNCSPDADSISLSPRFVSNAFPYYLSHTNAGQQYNSPCIDAGDSDILQNPFLVGWTTRTDNVPDTGVVDMGFHSPCGAPSIVVQPQNKIGLLGGSVIFNVTASGALPLSYQWRFNGLDLTNSTHVSGAISIVLTISNVQTNDAGSYSVVVSNALGGATSSNAFLTVRRTLPDRVAIFGSPHRDGWNEDVRAKVAQQQLSSQVDAFLVKPGNPVPTLAQLLPYDAVLVYSDDAFNDGAALGDVLADYVDSGRGVVLATFVFEDSGRGILGRIRTGGYLPFTTDYHASGTSLTLVMDQPSHPIVAGVSSFNGGRASYHNSSITTTTGAVQVAHWSNGQPLVGARETAAGRVVGLNFYPVSDAAGGGDFWNSGTDGGRLMANALTWAAEGQRVVLGFIPGSVMLSNGQFRCMLVSAPGLRFEIQASTNLSQTNWTVIAVLTNLTGTIPFTDTATSFDFRFYRARLLDGP